MYRIFVMFDNIILSYDKIVTSTAGIGSAAQLIPKSRLEFNSFDFKASLSASSIPCVLGFSILCSKEGDLTNHDIKRPIINTIKNIDKV